MIAEFKIQNYFSVRTEQTLSFVPSSIRQPEEEFLIEIKPGVKLLKMGVIYGANASGKTNILRALDDFRYLQVVFPEDKLSGVPYVPFMLDQTSKQSDTCMCMTFYVNKIKYDLSICFNSQRIVKEELYITEFTKPALGFRRTYNANLDQPEIEFGTKIKISQKSKHAVLSNTVNNSTVLAAFGKTNVEPSHLDGIFGFFSRSMRAVLKPNALLSTFVKNALRKDDSGKLKSFLLKMLRLSDFNIVDMSLYEEEDVISPEIQKIVEAGILDVDNQEEVLKRGTLKHDVLSFSHKADSGVFNLPEELESIGTVRFMGMSVLLSNLLLSDSFVSIDEIESSIHYELVAYFIKVFLANSCTGSQLLITTHDLNLMNEGFLRRDVMWSTDKQSSGETFLNRFSEMGLHKTMSVFNAYRQGKLGKLPFLGSIYINMDADEEC